VAFSVAGQPDFGLQEGAKSNEKAASVKITNFEYTFFVFIIVDYIQIKKQQKKGKDCLKPLFFKAFFLKGLFMYYTACTFALNLLIKIITNEQRRFDK